MNQFVGATRHCFASIQFPNDKTAKLVVFLVTKSTNYSKKFNLTWKNISNLLET